MSYTVHNLRTVYDALVTQVATTGKNVGQGQAPDDVTHPYAVVYPIGEDVDPDVRGVLSDPQQSTVIEFQVTCVGESLRQANWMANESRLVLSGWTPTVAGMTFGPVQLDAGLPAERDDDVQPPLFYAVDRFSVFVN